MTSIYSEIPDNTIKKLNINLFYSPMLHFLYTLKTSESESKDGLYIDMTNHFLLSESA